jgi:hypothetical protein
MFEGFEGFEGFEEFEEFQVSRPKSQIPNLKSQNSSNP